MKLTILCTSSLLLLVLQLNAQQQPNVSVNLNSNINAKVSNSSSYTYTVNNVNVNYSSNADNQNIQDDSPMKAKSFSKAFGIDKNDKINLSNKYGSITIKIWDKNEIKVDVDLKAYAKTDNEAQKLLDEVFINASKSADLVSFKTEMNSKNNSWGSNVRNGKTIWRREIKVNYIVYMPNSNALTASQQYGNITIGDFNGPTSIKIQYGNLIAGNLANNNNYLSIQYGKGNIKAMGGADIKHQYGGGLTIGTINNTLNLNAQYTAVKIETVNGATNIKHQYGNGTTIGSVNGALNVNTQYCTIQVNNLKGNVTSKAQYGKVIINNIETDNDVDVDAQYTNVDLNFAINYNADFNINTNYGSFKYGANVAAKKLGDDDRSYNSSKKYSGQIGKGGANRIIIKSQYGDLTFN